MEVLWGVVGVLYGCCGMLRDVVEVLLGVMRVLWGFCGCVVIEFLTFVLVLS